jgi:hypothetical protein
MKEYKLPKAEAEGNFARLKKAISNIERYILEIDIALADKGLDSFKRAELTYQKENKLQSTLEAQQKILYDRENYYQYYFLPKFEEDVKEFVKAKDSYLAIEKTAKEIATKLPNSEIGLMLSGYPKNNEDIELEMTYFKGLKVQVDAFIKCMEKDQKGNLRKV